MLEKPDLPEEYIRAAVQAHYQLQVSAVTFLPLGYDVNTAVYRIDVAEGDSYFLKLRKGNFRSISVALPRFLSCIGIATIIPPLESRTGELSGKLEDYTSILYPYIPGKDGYQVRLSPAHWVQLGKTLRKLHTVHLPPELSALIHRETYDPQWRQSVQHFLGMASTQQFAEPVANKLAVFLRSQEAEIRKIVTRAEQLAQSLQDIPTGFVLCHGDAHPGNYLVTEQGRLYLVDWDDPVFAPKERDLMCFGGGMSGDMPGGYEQRQFYRGYGEVELDHGALVYYRYERIIQDIAEFCKQLLLSESGGEDRQQAYKFLTRSFEPGSVLQAAVLTDQAFEEQGEFHDNTR